MIACFVIANAAMIHLKLMVIVVRSLFITHTLHLSLMIDIELSHLFIIMDTAFS